MYVAWLHAAYVVHRMVGVRAYGIGWMAGKVSRPFDFRFRGVPFRFVPAAGRSYCLLPAGHPNEPETHRFLERVLQMVPGIVFVDVGASVGEFAVTMAHDARVMKVYAFEPHPESCEALRESLCNAPSGKAEVIQKGVSSQRGSASFDFSDLAPTAAGLRAGTGTVELCTLDEELHIPGSAPVVLLVDIEGGELEAFKGAMNFIRTHRPLIIFEYNVVTRKSFRLQDAQALLSDYRIFRMRSTDSYLDNELSDTWNVVALPKEGIWAAAPGLPCLFVNPCDA